LSRKLGVTLSKKQPKDVVVKAVKKAARDIFKGMPKSHYHKVKHKRPTRRQKTRDYLDMWMEDQE